MPTTASPTSSTTSSSTSSTTAVRTASPASAAARSTQGALALDLWPRLDPPPRREAEVLGLDQPRAVRVRRDVEAWAHRFTQAAVEVAGGDRPVSQLLRWTSTEVYQDLDRRAQLVARARLHGTAAPAARRHPQVRPHVLGVHACVVSPTAVEVSAHVRHGQRSRAVAARFERDHGRWTCTALEFA
ncbi:Rv3235 family protein [Nocardioides perillae]|uniref:3-hydroxyacyl-CoA dehydrogenase n=1 Tax=Nocardioides perillae TaxID=1119534 RepID=A0A7Y9US42_9ACTN|nr:hypothetical protein [Nocardioides perillae]